jgi:hypothetical protein
MDGFLEAFQPEFDVESSGIHVSAYSRRVSPPTLSCLWQLSTGWLGTFVDEGLASSEGLNTVIGAIGVQPSPAGAPRLMLQAPLQPGDARNPAYRERVSFEPDLDDSQDWPSLRFARVPDRAGVGSSMSGEGPWIRASTTLASGVSVICSGPRAQAAQWQAYADEIAASIRAAG